jgi:hypothetical protein
MDCIAAVSFHASPRGTNHHPSPNNNEFLNNQINAPSPLSFRSEFTLACLAFPSEIIPCSNRSDAPTSNTSQGNLRQGSSLLNSKKFLPELLTPIADTKDAKKSIDAMGIQIPLRTPQSKFTPASEIVATSNGKMKLNNSKLISNAIVTTIKNNTRNQIWSRVYHKCLTGRVILIEDYAYA